jgi:hypothetical protein
VNHPVFNGVRFLNSLSFFFFRTANAKSCSLSSLAKVRCSLFPSPFAFAHLQKPKETTRFSPFFLSRFSLHILSCVSLLFFFFCTVSLLFLFLGVKNPLFSVGGVEREELPIFLAWRQPDSGT